MAVFPSELIQSASTITSENPGIISTLSFSGQRFTRERSNNQRWSFVLQFAMDAKSINFKSAFAQLAKLNRGMEIMEIIHPIYKTSQGSVSNNITLLQNHFRGDKSITLKGFDNLEINAMKRGDFVRFANSLKVYQIVSDFSSNGVGDATCVIFPALRKNTPVDTQMIYTDVSFSMYTSDEISMQLSAPAISAIADLKFIENLD